MGLIEQARQDWAQITGDLDGWGKALTFTTPDGSMTVTANGLHSKHHNGFDQQGVPVNAKLAHASISEHLLTSLGYVTRNARGEVALVDHKLSVTDSEGTMCSYMIRECKPSETFGVLVFILGDFE